MSGHTASGNIGSGAVGYINESDETRKVAPKVVEYLTKLGVEATFIKLDKAKTSSYLYDQVSLANSKGSFDCVVQIHFNAGSSDPNSKTTGTETYYRTTNGKVFADRVNAKLSTIFTNRGSKNSKPDLYWLKHTNPPAILVEVCFVDDKDDVSVYKNNFDKVCRLIAEGLANKTLSDNASDVVINKPTEAPTTPTDETDYNLKEIVTYLGDVDAFSAIMLSQKKACPLMKKSDYDSSGIKAKVVYQVGGKSEDTDKYVTLQNVAKLL